MPKKKIPATPDAAVPAALVVEPMNEHPSEYPLALLSSMSDDARTMYRRGIDSSTGRLSRDIFDPKTRGYQTREEQDAFVPTERMLAAIAELEAVHLASYNPEYKSLHITRVHEHYAYAQGRGSQYIKVSIFDKHPEEAQLLAVFIGGDLEGQGSRGDIPEVAVRARHATATDSEHDASSAAIITVRNLGQPQFGGYGLTTYTGVMVEARLYPIGVDPLTVSDQDTRAGTELCDRCEEPHPFAPYQPPSIRELSGPHFVKIETRPLRPYTVAAPPAFVVANANADADATPESESA